MLLKIVGTRPQGRLAVTSVASSGPLRGANNNMSFLRPMAANGGNNGGTTTARGQQQPPQQQSNNRANSQSRDMPFSVNLSSSYPAAGGVQQPQQQQPFVVDSSTPPPNLEAAAQPAAISLYPYHHGYFPLTNGIYPLRGFLSLFSLFENLFISSLL